MYKENVNKDQLSTENLANKKENDLLRAFLVNKNSYIKGLTKKTYDNKYTAYIFFIVNCKDLEENRPQAFCRQKVYFLG